MKSIEEHMKMEECMVEDSALLLDDVFPEWEEFIDESTLDLSTLDDCVLGQLYCHYGKGLRHIRMAYDEPLSSISYKVRGFVSHPFCKNSFCKRESNNFYVSTLCSARRMERLWIDQRDRRLAKKDSYPTRRSTIQGLPQTQELVTA